MWGLGLELPRLGPLLLWQSLGLVSKFELGLGGYGLNYIIGSYCLLHRE